MSEIVEFNFNNNAIACVVINGNPWFRGKDIATSLGYVDTKQAIAQNVSEDDRKKIEELIPAVILKKYGIVTVETNNISEAIK